MYNYINTVIAILEKAHLITPEAGKKLAGEMQSMIHQHRYEDAVQMVEGVAGKVENFLAEPWNAHIAALERRVAELEEAAVKDVKTVEKKVVAKVKP